MHRVIQENYIPSKMNCLSKGFQAGRDLASHRKGKEACLAGQSLGLGVALWLRAVPWGQQLHLRKPYL